jgi:hypothetical protein
MQSLVKGGAALPRAYYRHSPMMIGKRPVWNSVVTRLLARGHDLGPLSQLDPEPRAFLRRLGTGHHRLTEALPPGDTVDMYLEPGAARTADR